jgi:hypothetical protein
MTSRFYCNTRVFSVEEGAHHKEMTRKLAASWKSFVETKDGYKFFFRSCKVTLTELNNWASNERRCCPFFDFQVTSEGDGRVICLQLAGDDGTKPFIRSQFLVP